MSSRWTEFADGIFHVDMTTSPQAVFAAGTRTMILGVLVSHETAAASHTVTFESADGTTEYFSMGIAAHAPYPMPIKWVAHDGLRLASDPASADVHVTVFYVAADQ